MIHNLVRKIRQPILLCRRPTPLQGFGVQIRVACLLRLAGAVGKHDVGGYARIKANEGQPHVIDSAVHVVVLCSPAIKLVAKAIHLLKVDPLHSYCPAEHVAVREVVSEMM